MITQKDLLTTAMKHKAILEGDNRIGVGSWADFGNENLAGLDFSGLDFTGANFTGANMSCCNLKGANFTAANMEGACLTDAETDGAIFDRTYL